MKTHALLDIPRWDLISKKIYTWTRIYNTGIYNRELGHWHNVRHHLILEYVPELGQWFDSQNLTVAWMAIIIVPSNDAIPIHMDTLGDVCPPGVELSDDSRFINDRNRIRILCPIRNCQGSSTRFFDVPLEDVKVVIDEDEQTSFYGPTAVIKDGDFNPYQQIAQVELTSPVIFDSAVAHDVVPCRDHEGLRISITIATNESLRSYLLD